MLYESYDDLQRDYLLLSQNNSSFLNYTTDKQFKFINKCLAKRYKRDYKMLVKYEKKKNKKLKKIFKYNKKKMKIISNSLAEKVYNLEQKQVLELFKIYEKKKVEKKKNKLLKKLKIDEKTTKSHRLINLIKLIFRTKNLDKVQGISSQLEADGAKKELEEASLEASSKEAGESLKES